MLSQNPGPTLNNPVEEIIKTYYSLMYPHIGLL